MNTEKIAKIEEMNSRTDLPNFKVGDTIEVDNIIREGDKQRIQKFRGLVIAIKGSGNRKMFTIRKISYGVGVEKIFPLNSPNIAGITVIKHGSTRRSKLYYLRDRIGKLALKVKLGKPAPVIEHADAPEAVTEEVTEDRPEPETAETAEVEQNQESAEEAETADEEPSAEVDAEVTEESEAKE